MSEKPSLWMRGRQALADRSLRGLAKNAGMLFSGNSLGSVFGLVAFSVTGRALSPALLGLLVLVQTYVATIGGLLSFQSAHCLLQYGAGALAENRPDRFQSLLKTILLVDLITGGISMLLAIAGASLAGRWMHWDQQVITMARVFSVTLLFGLVGVPTAVLQLFNRFKLIASQTVLSAVVNVVGVLIAALCHASLWGFLIAWIVTRIGGALILWGMAWRELAARGHEGFLRSGLGTIRGQIRPMMSFLVMTNLNSTVRMLVRGPENFVLGRYLGPAAVGQYNVARRFAGVVGLLFDPLSQAIYPELARLQAQGRIRQFVRLVLLSSASGAGMMLVCALGYAAFGRMGLRLTVGQPYLDAYPVMIWLVFGFVAAGLAVPLQPAVFSFKRPGIALVANLIGGAIYWIVLALTLQPMGASGPGVANLVYFLGWSAVMVFFVMRLMPSFPKPAAGDEAAPAPDTAGKEGADVDAV